MSEPVAVMTIEVPGSEVGRAIALAVAEYADVDEFLAALDEGERVIGKLRDDLAAAYLAAGASWTELGELFGTSRQQATRKFGHCAPNRATTKGTAA